MPVSRAMAEHRAIVGLFSHGQVVEQPVAIAGEDVATSAKGVDRALPRCLTASAANASSGFGPVPEVISGGDAHHQPSSGSSRPRCSSAAISCNPDAFADKICSTVRRP